MFLNNCKCSWCNRDISEYNLEGMEKDNKENKVHFCNFICAKHYNDLIKNIYLDINNYNELYKNNKLNNSLSKIFIQVSKSGFDFMPKIDNKEVPESYKERIKMCRKYLKEIYEM